MLGFPDAFVCSTSQISGLDLWLTSSQARHSAASVT
jgi:hypothetical protein